MSLPASIVNIATVPAHTVPEKLRCDYEEGECSRGGDVRIEVGRGVLMPNVWMVIRIGDVETTICLGPEQGAALGCALKIAAVHAP